MGCIHSEQIEEALELQRVRPRRLSQILTDLGYVSEDDLLEALSEQYDIPFEKDIHKDLDASLTTKTPIAFRSISNALSPKASKRTLLASWKL